MVLRCSVLDPVLDPVQLPLSRSPPVRDERAVLDCTETGYEVTTAYVERSIHHQLAKPG